MSLDGSAWTDTLTLSSPGENQAASLYLQKPDGTIAQPITVYYNLDTEAPAGIRASYAPNRFFQFLHTVTFGLFFRETVTVTLTAEDSLSGVREFTYTLSDGRTGSTASSFRIDPQFKGSFTVTASDEAGNESAPVSFEAFAVDSEAPDVPTLSFGGYTPGQWTNTAVTVTVSGSSSLSGIKGYQVRTGNGPWQDMPALETAPATSEAPASVLSSILTADTDGETAYAFRAVSNNGLAGPATDPVVIAMFRPFRYRPAGIRAAGQGRTSPLPCPPYPPLPPLSFSSTPPMTDRPGILFRAASSPFHRISAPPIVSGPSARRGPRVKPPRRSR